MSRTDESFNPLIALDELQLYLLAAAVALQHFKVNTYIQGISEVISEGVRLC